MRENYTNYRGFFRFVRKFVRQQRAIFLIFGLVALGVSGVIHLFNISNYQNVQLITRASIEESKKTFFDLEKNVQSMLLAALQVLASNEKISMDFMSGDRVRLYETVRPIFENLQKQNSITHWYFIHPEPVKTCFLRVHRTDLFDDVVDRASLEECIRTKRVAFGKELGQTALALRAVYPVYFRKRLVGYMELGVQMSDFMQMLKRQTGNEYGLLMKKTYVEQRQSELIGSRKQDAASIARGRNDLKGFKLSYRTSSLIRMSKLKKQLESVSFPPSEGVVLDEFSSGQKYFVSGLFPMLDSQGRKVGGVFFIRDISVISRTMQNQKERIVWMLLGLMGAMAFLMLFFHTRAGRELRKYRNGLEDMVKESTSELIEANIRLSLEIKEHESARLALLQEAKARGEAEQKQIEAVKHAERSARMASIGVLAAGITHEINQPLNAIKVTADSIQYWHKRNPGILPEVFTSQLDIISRSVQRIVEIIRHMRTFWVIPNSTEISDVDLNRAVENALSLTRQKIYSHGIQIRLTLDPVGLTVKGNMIHFEQIIVNLLINSMHALNEMEGENRKKEKVIDIFTVGEGDLAMLTVRDNGPGFPTEDMDKLFDPFFSTYNNEEGMGLGLAIVKRYIDQYNGTIFVSNRTDGGAQFTIKFPVAGHSGFKVAGESTPAIMN